MKRTALIIGLLIVGFICFSQDLKGKIVELETGKVLDDLVVKIIDSENITVTDSIGQFILNTEERTDKITLRIYSSDYSELEIKNIPSNQNIDLGELNLIKVPVELNVSYHGVSRLKNKIYQYQDKRRYRKSKRKFEFKDILISNNGNSYWMRATDKEYIYEIDYKEINKTIANKPQ